MSEFKSYIGAAEVLSDKNSDHGSFVPTYEILKSYDHFFGSAGTDGPVKKGGLDETLKAIVYVVKNFNYQAEKLARHLKADSLEQSAFNIWHFCTNNIAYKNDKFGFEEIRTPNRSWVDRNTGIDCDCFAIFTSSLLLQMGYSPMFAVVAFDGNADFGHIYTVINSREFSAPYDLNDYNGGAIRGGVVVDPVLRDVFNKHPKRITKVKLMNIQILNGLPDDNINQSIINQIAIFEKSNDKRSKAEVRKLRFILSLTGHPDRSVYTSIMPLVKDIVNGQFVYFSENHKLTAEAHLKRALTDQPDTKKIIVAGVGSLGSVLLRGKLLPIDTFRNTFAENFNRQSDVILRLRVNGQAAVGVKPGNVIRIFNAPDTTSQNLRNMNGYHVIDDLGVQPNANGSYSFVYLTTGRATWKSEGDKLLNDSDFEINTAAIVPVANIAGWKKGAATADKYMLEADAKIANCRRIFKMINEMDISAIKEENHIKNFQDIVGDNEAWYWASEAAYNRCVGLRTTTNPYFQNKDLQAISDIYKAAAGMMKACEDNYLSKEKKIEDWKKVSGWEKVVDAFMTYNPLTVAARNGLLLALKLNFRNMAKRLSVGTLSPAEAKQRRYSESDVQKIKAQYDKNAILFDKLGGKKENFYNAVSVGKTKKALFGGPKISGLGMDPATITALTAAAVPIGLILKDIKAVGVLFKGEEAEEDTTTGTETIEPIQTTDTDWLNFNAADPSADPSGDPSADPSGDSNSNTAMIIAVLAVLGIGVASFSSKSKLNK